MCDVRYEIVLLFTKAVSVINLVKKLESEIERVGKSNFRGENTRGGLAYVYDNCRREVMYVLRRRINFLYYGFLIIVVSNALHFIATYVSSVRASERASSCRAPLKNRQLAMENTYVRSLRAYDVASTTCSRFRAKSLRDETERAAFLHLFCCTRLCVCVCVCAR